MARRQRQPARRVRWQGTEYDFYRGELVPVRSPYAIFWRKLARPAMMVAFAAVVIFTSREPPDVGVGVEAEPGTSSLFGLSRGNCIIKGNISINTGERIYHVPGQKHYAETRISPQHGERWFCSESEARSAGWRRSRV
jgi:hypothetical protein